MDEGLRELTDRPYVLFGFSMGAILAFELALRRQRQDHRMPVALVLAGRGGEGQDHGMGVALVLAGRCAPRTVCLTVSRAAFSREKIVRELTRLGGTDPVLLQDGPFLESWPISRAARKFTSSSTTSRHTRPSWLTRSSVSIRTCVCTSRRPTRHGSTRLNCGSPRS